MHRSVHLASSLAKEKYLAWKRQKRNTLCESVYLLRLALVLDSQQAIYCVEIAVKSI